MGSDASATDTAHPAGAQALERSTSGQPRFPFMQSSTGLAVRF